MLWLPSFLHHRSSVYAVVVLLATGIVAQEKTVWSEQEKPIVEQLRGLRKLDDTVRALTTKELALETGNCRSCRIS